MDAKDVLNYAYSSWPATEKSAMWRKALSKGKDIWNSIRNLDTSAAGKTLRSDLAAAKATRRTARDAAHQLDHLRKIEPGNVTKDQFDAGIRTAQNSSSGVLSAIDALKAQKKLPWTTRNKGLTLGGVGLGTAIPAGWIGNMRGNSQGYDRGVTEAGDYLANLYAQKIQALQKKEDNLGFIGRLFGGRVFDGNQ